MTSIGFLIAPVLGGIIGYITNDIAIRMLFRPHTAKYIFGMHIPFTPGIIPKEKGRIAEAIGAVISENLMNQEVLERYLLSEEMIGKLRTSVESFIGVQTENEETVREFLSHYLSNEEIESIASSVNQGLTAQLSAKLADSTLGSKIAQMAMDHVSQKLNGEGIPILLAGIGGVLGGMAGLIGAPIIGRFLGLLREPAENLLANNINDLLRDKGNKIVSTMVDDEVNSFLDKKVCTLLEGHDEQLSQSVNTIESIYRKVINQHLPRILSSIDISKIVRERIKEMDVNETERLILQVMDKELKAIVWLGALLGLIMGSVNCFIT